MRAPRSSSGPPLTGPVAVDGVKASRSTEIVRQVVALAGGGLRGARLGVWGLQPRHGRGVGDSAAVAVARRLVLAGATVSAYEPTAAMAPGVELVASPLLAVDRADVLVILTAWPELGLVDLADVRRAMAHPRLVDACGVVDRAEAEALGFVVAPTCGRPRRVADTAARRRDVPIA